MDMYDDIELKDFKFDEFINLGDDYFDVKGNVRIWFYKKDGKIKDIELEFDKVVMDDLEWGRKDITYSPELDKLFKELEFEVLDTLSGRIEWEGIQAF